MMGSLAPHAGGPWVTWHGAWPSPFSCRNIRQSKVLGSPCRGRPVSPLSSGGMHPLMQPVMSWARAAPRIVGCLEILGARVANAHPLSLGEGLCCDSHRAHRQPSSPLPLVLTAQAHPLGPLLGIKAQTQVHLLPGRATARCQVPGRSAHCPGPLSSALEVVVIYYSFVVTGIHLTSGKRWPLNASLPGAARSTPAPGRYGQRRRIWLLCASWSPYHQIFTRSLPHSHPCFVCKMDSMAEAIWHVTGWPAYTGNLPLLPIQCLCHQQTSAYVSSISHSRLGDE
jgi:hypothetical protein